MLNLLRRVLDFFREESARLESLLEEGRREPLVRAIRLVESAVRRTDLPASTRERVIAQLREIRQQADSLPGTLRFAVALAALVRDLYLEIRIHSPNAKPAVKALHAARLAGQAGGREQQENRCEEFSHTTAAGYRVSWQELPGVCRRAAPGRG